MAIRMRFSMLAAALLLPACGDGSSSSPPGPLPGAFNLLSPSNGQVNVPAKPTFTWEAAADAASYRLEVATDAGFADIVLSQTGMASSPFMPGSELPRAADLWWRVTAVNAAGTALAGDAPRGFRTVPTPPGPFSLVAPEDGQDHVGRTPVLEWSAAAGAASYTVEVSMTPDFSAPFVTGSLAGLQYSFFSNLLPDTTYHWRIVAVNAGGSTPGGGRSFRTEPVLGVVHPHPDALVDLVYDPVRDRIYLSNPTDGTIETFDVASETFLAPVAVGVNPRGLDLTPDNARLIVCVAGARHLAVLDLVPTPPVIERTVALPLEYAWEEPVPYTIACTANGFAFVGLYNGAPPLRKISLTTWTGEVLNAVRPYASMSGPPLGVNPARTRLVTCARGVSGGSWFHYSTDTDAFTEIPFDDGSSFAAAVNAAGTRVGFTGRILDFSGLTHAGLDHHAMLFHPDGLRAVRLLWDEALVKVSDLTTYRDLDILPIPADLTGPGVLSPDGGKLFALATGGLLALPLTPNRPPLIEPLGRLVIGPGRSASARALARDPEGDAVTLSAGPLPPNATFNITSGELRFSPEASQAGRSYTVWIRASDGAATKMARADLVVPEAGAPALTLVPLPGASLGVAVIDEIRNRVYVASGDGNRVEVVDLATLGRLDPIPVGDQPYGVDLDAVASRLVVCPSGTTFIEAVDLTATPPAVVLREPVPDTTFTSLRQPRETGVAANGKALFASSWPGTGFTAVWELTLSTGTVVARDVPDSLGHVREPGNIAVSRDRSRIFVGGGSTSAGAVHRYASASDTFLARVDTGRFFDQLAANADGTRMAMTSSPGVPSKARVYDGGLVFLGEVTEASSGAAFAPGPGRVYWTSRASPVLVASELSGFTELFRVPLPAAPRGRLVVNAAGDRVVVVVEGGVAVVEVAP